MFSLNLLHLRNFPDGFVLFCFSFLSIYLQFGGLNREKENMALANKTAMLNLLYNACRYNFFSLETLNFATY